MKGQCSSQHLSLIATYVAHRNVCRSSQRLSLADPVIAVSNFRLYQFSLQLFPLNQFSISGYIVLIIAISIIHYYLVLYNLCIISISSFWLHQILLYQVIADSILSYSVISRSSSPFEHFFNINFSSMFNQYQSLINVFSISISHQCFLKNLSRVE